jgi:hypothetical protein
LYFCCLLCFLICRAKATIRGDDSNTTALESDPSLSKDGLNLKEELAEKAHGGEADLAHEDEPTHDNVPPSPARAASPIMTENLTSKLPLRAAQDEVTITGEVVKAPETLNVLAKVIGKKESPMAEKGKAKLELPPLESLDVGSLHQAFLTWLFESRETEAVMVGTLKRKCEVYSLVSLLFYIFVCSPQVLRIANNDNT